jgi:hypothetical protein
MLIRAMLIRAMLIRATITAAGLWIIRVTTIMEYLLLKR